MSARRNLSLVILSLTLALLAPGVASACGGFFCTTIPVDQAAEQIIFTMDEGRVGVDVLASGTVGPFAYDVVTSPDPQAMVTWLRDNGYRIDPAMEPLIGVYTDEGLVFLAM